MQIKNLKEQTLYIRTFFELIFFWKIEINFLAEKKNSAHKKKKKEKIEFQQH